jgi:glycosyltransferase involved in cell wall biosynthesis
MMKVVIVGGPLPYPANSGGRIRTLNLMTRLARRHEVTYLGPLNPDRAEARDAITYLRDHGVEPVEYGHTVPRKSGAAFYARLAANLATPLPYSVASHCGPALSRAVARLAAGGGVNLWQAEWSGATVGFRGLRGAPTLLSAQNVETLIWERTAEAETTPARRWYARIQAKKYERFERRAFRGATRSMTVSEADAEVVRRRFGVGASKVDVVDNGIDRASFELVEAERDASRILYLGSLDWRPNLDAAALLLDTIFPLVRASAPSARLEIVGRNPPDWLGRRVAEVEGASLHTNVPDVRPFLAGCGVMAVPLRVGGGSRLKILEALACGLPVVSTRVGAEGLLLTGGEHLTLADDPSGFASALAAAVLSPSAALSLASAGRRLVLDRYDWDALADRLERSWELCVGGVGSGVKVGT